MELTKWAARKRAQRATPTRDGHRRTKKTKLCKVCGTEFTPSHSKKHSTCSKKCLSEIGRRNAMKRWHGAETGNAACLE